MERKKYLYQADYPESIALEKIWFTDRKLQNKQTIAHKERALLHYFSHFEITTIMIAKFL